MKVEYETIIGLEVHSQLLTNSKMFCSCDSDYQDAPPNTKVCPVCMGMPGVLPVVNKQAVELVIRTGLSLGCDISKLTKFDRKNYPYPDLMKGYQISQFDRPIAEGGELEVQDADGSPKIIGITRVHLEEDVAKLLHRKESHGEGYSLLDINRAGVPLMEIVSEPDMRSPEEAHSYLTTLHSIVRYIGASTANMEEGSFRCDANISIRPYGKSELGEKVEIKNINSFKSVFRALKYEEGRQRDAIESGEPIIQETRGWSDDRGTTVSQRTKEYASDYRYFPEPDLPPVIIPREWVREISSQIPELPVHKRDRYINEFGLSEYDANLLTASKISSDFFDKTIKAFESHSTSDTRFRAKRAANLINVELARLVNDSRQELENSGLSPLSLSELIVLTEQGNLSNSMAKVVLEEIFTNGGTPSLISEKMGMSQISDVDSISSTINSVIEENPKAVSDFHSGKRSVLRYMLGQVMKATKGAANPEIATELLEKSLEELR
ncbi:MAG: Asp-tRNA(Asn)/Glu-tRNA(Gln) amidotransferase subunit GatB [Chloroflexota bacterium]|nr:Asp-tRNA(Asn)/Glu-tRNA(Gln) amidotransferase subunit GatB [Chloroflexota bacterium]